MDEPQWLLWARELQAIAQTGLTFSQDNYDLDRYRRLRAIAVEMLAVGSNTALERVQGLFDQELGYPTPKVDVRAAVFRDDRILMVREISDGRWTLPGGWVDVNDSPAHAVEREILEESGYRARAVKLAALFDKNRHPHPPSVHHIYKLMFLCELLGGSATVSQETDAVDFFALDALPELSRGRILESQIARLYQHQLQRELPTDFD